MYDGERSISGAATAALMSDYFEPGRFVDQWVLERWDAAERRWVMVDAQIDGLQRKALDLDFEHAER